MSVVEGRAIGTMNRANQGAAGQRPSEDGLEGTLHRGVGTAMMNRANQGAAGQTLNEDDRKWILQRGAGTAMMNRANLDVGPRTLSEDGLEGILRRGAVTVMLTAEAPVIGMMNKQNQGAAGQRPSEDGREGTRLQRVMITGREKSSEEVERNVKNATAREIKGKKTRIASAAKKRMRHQNRELNSRNSTMYLHKCLVIWLFPGCTEYVKSIV